MSPAEVIKARRKTLGIDPGDLAIALGITDASYEDLESYDDELESVISIAQALTLARALKLSLHQILFGQPPNEPQTRWEDLPQLVNQSLRSRAIPLPEFEDLVGWELGELLSNTTQAQDKYPLMFLHDLSGVLGVPYPALVPSHMA